MRLFQLIFKHCVLHYYWQEGSYDIYVLRIIFKICIQQTHKLTFNDIIFVVSQGEIQIMNSLLCFASLTTTVKKKRFVRLFWLRRLHKNIQFLEFCFAASCCQIVKLFEFLLQTRLKRLSVLDHEIRNFLELFETF